MGTGNDGRVASGVLLREIMHTAIGNRDAMRILRRCSRHTFYAARRTDGRLRHYILAGNSGDAYSILRMFHQEIDTRRTPPLDENRRTDVLR